MNMIVFYNEKECNEIIFFKNKSIEIEKVFSIPNFDLNNFMILDINLNFLFYIFLNKKFKKVFIIEHNPIFLFFEEEYHFKFIYKINKEDYLYFLENFCTVTKANWSVFGF